MVLTDKAVILILDDFSCGEQSGVYEQKEIAYEECNNK